jgi:hypothetical protein
VPSTRLKGNVTGTRRNGHADLRPADAYLLKEWAQHLREKGWKPSSVQRALNRLRVFARVAKGGLCGAEKEDVAAFADQRCKATGVTVATLVRSDNWRETVRTLRAFFRWTHGRWSGVNTDPTVGILSPPTRSRGPRIKAADGRLHERVLAAPDTIRPNYPNAIDADSPQPGKPAP